MEVLAVAFVLCVIGMEVCLVGIAVNEPKNWWLPFMIPAAIAAWVWLIG